ncbi:hypothetical protein C3L23_05300 [Nautilia sp. PV-1]|uniref:hypothetical protein n=1 Tax=Nautilia sp. PV-1 TaxID=2579250 RepID=UPI000FD7B8A8|nr:hypothetical protein [Nautilia sp. PV-1]AZV46707.1 hypothetical protein C3L23_05300 [Nautilia sp. PV-1]
MVNILLQKIKELETELLNIKQKNSETKELITSLCKECKIEKSKKSEFKKKLLKIISNLENVHIEKFYDENNALKYTSFIEIAKNINSGFLVIVDADVSEEKKKFILGFLINKISPFFTLLDNKIIGIIDEKQLKEIRALHKIPFFNSQTGEFTEIEIYKVVFDTDEFNALSIEKAKKIFDELRIRPSYKNKHYIEYSLIKNKVIDFEKEELNKQKQKFAFVFDEKYPNLEVILKREIKNIPFILAVLERIDEEMEDIKKSKGIENIVNRMLNFIEMNLPEEGILEEVKFLRQRLSS